jgi:hypothetical protein
MDAIKRPFQVKVINPQEIRMGSPYSHCHIELVGFDKTKLPNAGWQDKYTWTDDSKKLVLIKWNLENNEPGFHLFLIDTETGETKESPKLFGLPQAVSIIDENVKLSTFLYNKEKSKSSGDLCCYIDQEFDFSKYYPITI